MKHRARKRFGQNFLHDQTIIQHIIHAIAPQRDDSFIEIGPGMGAITLPLAQRLDKLRAIEIDRDLQSLLRSIPELSGKLELINADALKVDFSQWGSQLRVIGNLPYNISTPLLMHLLRNISVIKDMHFMLQKEVVVRMAAPPANKTYGRLSVICQYYCEVDVLFDVPAHCFDPVPKVTSAIVRLTPHQGEKYPVIARELLEAITAKGFSMRRKTLANNLKGLITLETLLDMGIDPKQRPEQLSVHDWVRLGLQLSQVQDF